MEKVSDNFTIYRYDNGYMIEICGRNKDEDWVTAKVVCTNVDELIELVKESLTLPID